MGFIFGMVGVVALIRLEKLTRTLKEKGILEEDYNEESVTGLRFFTLKEWSPFF